MAEPFFTIGHSTRSLEELAALLEPNAVRCLVDVRTVPRSRRNPQYDRDTMPVELARFGIGYEHIAALGGLRPRDPDVAPEVNGFWENRSFHNYADYAMSAAFQAGLQRLRALGAERRCAIMCAESVWWQCHRRIITDYLLASGEAVFHIVGGPVPEPALLTPGAAPGPGRTLVYPSRQGSLY
jgi:uncharacterized protein (DUF488 family)